MIIPVISLCIISAMVIFYKIKQQSIAAKYSDCLLAFPIKKSKTTIIVIAGSYMLVAILFFRSFPQMQSTLLSMVAIFACYISLKDAILWKYSGVYKDCLLLHGKVLKKMDVLAFPSLDYEEPSTTIPNNMLKVVTKSRGEFFLTFDSEEQCKEVLQIIKHWI